MTGANALDSPHIEMLEEKACKCDFCHHPKGQVFEITARSRVECMCIGCLQSLLTQILNLYPIIIALNVMDVFF